MKNTIHIMKKPVLFAIAALALLASCAKTEVVPVQNDGDQLISFQTAVSRQGTRALIDGTVYPTGVPFGTFAYFNAKNTAFPADAELYIPHSQVQYDADNNRWLDLTTPYYWPKQGSLTFFSYSPYAALSTVTDCSETDGITIATAADPWDVDINQEVDILIADYKTNQTYNVGNTTTYTNGVPTIFRHKLAQIAGIAFKTAEKYHGDRDETTAQVGDKFFYVNSIKINNIEYKGSYESGNDVSSTQLGEWTVDAATKNYTWYDVTAGTAFDDTAVSIVPEGASSTDLETNKYLLVMPQEFAQPDDMNDLSGDKTFQITYTIKTCTDVDMNNITFSTETVKDVIIPLWQIQGGTVAPTAADATPWSMNKKMTYTFTISLDQILWDPSVVDWDTTTNFNHTIK